MAEIVTYRDLHAAVSQLIAQHRENARPLEEYLLVLWGIALRRCDRGAFTPNEFFGMLAEAFAAEPESFTADILDDGVVDLRELERLDTRGYEGWECRIARQIVDLREMGEAGLLADGRRHPGMLSPRGSVWYTFDPCTFLEYAASDWLTYDEDEPVPEISWERFRGFLGSGQWA